MNILEIGNSLQSRYIRETKFLSNTYFLDADILIIDLDAVFMEFYDLFVHDGITDKIVRVDTYTKFLEQVEGRKEELHKYFKGGGNLLLFHSDRSLKKFKIKDGETTTENEFDFLTIFGLTEKEFSTKEVTGHNTTNDDSYDVFFAEFYPTYEVVYTKYRGRPIASVTKTNEAVALRIPFEKGNIVILPKIELTYEDGEDDEYRFHRFCRALEGIDGILKEQKADTTEVKLPEWVKGYHIGNEKQEIELLDDLLKEAEEIYERIELQETKLKEYDQLKMLLFESGKNLEAMVEKIFDAFGYEILESVANRDDVIIKYNDEIAVIEVKGVNGSSGEKQAAQLEKWVSEYTIDHGVVPKGILIVNAFRDKPLDERTEKSFPEQMLKFSKRRDHCLLTTTQLLDLYLSFTNADVTFEQIHAILFKTIGVVDQDITMIKKNDVE
jgi:hypothetical protein